jgi:hypothetical protein
MRLSTVNDFTWCFILNRSYIDLFLEEHIGISLTEMSGKRAKFWGICLEVWVKGFNQPPLKRAAKLEQKK